MAEPSRLPPTVAPVAPVAAPATPSDAPPLTMVEIERLVSDPTRDANDRATDARRHPRELLAFIGVRPGMRVADVGAGFGYMTELLARAVGPSGVVYGQNTPYVLQRFAEEIWSQRLTKPELANVQRLDRAFSDPFPDHVRGLDAVVNVLFYHDFEWQGVDRAAHNAAVFAALRPGGVYVIVDHSALEGAGVSGSATLHRVEERLVIEELEAAGFVLTRRADFLRNPQDTRDWNALPWRNDRDELSDKFVLEFAKPEV